MSTGIRLDKPWQPLTFEAISDLPAQLGVYQVADAAGQISSIGYAGARDPFGIRTALHRELDKLGDTAAQFRYEFNSNYRSRWNELLMIHLADFGELPAPQAHLTDRLGRLTPLS